MAFALLGITSRFASNAETNPSFPSVSAAYGKENQSRTTLIALSRGRPRTLDDGAFLSLVPPTVLATAAYRSTSSVS
ncbi:MAG: hypothetical protein JO212_10865 [Acetobacteraceae bacterium]|nr:hypothetical protein [Acetobacteraceae bacterium]